MAPAIALGTSILMLSIVITTVLLLIFPQIALGARDDAIEYVSFGSRL
jgi:hypothetical protein